MNRNQAFNKFRLQTQAPVALYSLYNPTVTHYGNYEPAWTESTCGKAVQRTSYKEILKSIGRVHKTFLRVVL